MDETTKKIPTPDPRSIIEQTSKKTFTLGEVLEIGYSLPAICEIYKQNNTNLWIENEKYPGVEIPFQPEWARNIAFYLYAIEFYLEVRRHQLAAFPNAKRKQQDIEPSEKDEEKTPKKKKVKISE